MIVPELNQAPIVYVGMSVLALSHIIGLLYFEWILSDKSSPEYFDEKAKSVGRHYAKNLTILIFAVLILLVIFKIFGTPNLISSVDLSGADTIFFLLVSAAVSMTLRFHIAARDVISSLTDVQSDK